MRSSRALAETEVQTYAEGRGLTLERRVLIFAPTGNDARLTADFLAINNVPPLVCSSMIELCDSVRQGCGAIILAEEALFEKSILMLVQHLGAQPEWSDIPLILITSGGEVSQTQLRRLNIFGPAGNVTVLERPFRPATLISTVEVALRTRQRQYEARDSVESLKRAHEKSQAASRAKDDFLAALSHELRTPLNPVLLIASEAAEDYTLPEAVRLNFETIRNNIELEARLIDDLLDLTRVTHNKMELQLVPAPVGRLIEDAIATCLDDLHNKELFLIREIRHPQKIILVDGARVTQILWNLLKNAIKFTPEGGTITIRSYVEQNNDSEIVLIEVQDTGTGIKPENLERIFNAFEQAGRNITRQFGGLGLGLAISKAIAECHHGSLTATSEGVGQGSTFTLTLPAKIPEKTEMAEPGLSSGNKFSAPVAFFAGLDRPLRILLVEDHSDTAQSLCTILERRGYLVKIAEDVAGGLKLAAAQPFDLLMSDLGLPDATGYDLMKQIRKNYSIPGIAISGYGTQEDIRKCNEAGFSGHLTKPVEISRLEEMVSRIVLHPHEKSSL
jgi:signal transduction histidine kinase/ActR/RegA family two-component response regulator